MFELQMLDLCTYPTVVRRGDSVEGHEQVVDHDRDAVGGQEDHDHDLEPAGIAEVGQEPVHGLVVRFAIVRGGRGGAG